LTETGVTEVEKVVNLRLAAIDPAAPEAPVAVAAAPSWPAGPKRLRRAELDGGVAGPCVLDEDTATTITVLANDSDADGDTPTVSAVDTSGTAGTVTNNGSDVTYDPNGQFESLAVGETATDIFRYTITDGQGGSDTATVTVTVTGANDGPTAADDAVGPTAHDTTFTTANVLVNDTDVDASDTLSVSALDTTGTAGLVTNNSDGTFGYDPNGAFNSLAIGAESHRGHTVAVL